MQDLADRLEKVRGDIDRALAAVEGDGSASPVLVAVVREFHAKGQKAADGLGGPTERDGVIELEQAGDSAKAAAEADDGIGDGTRQAVLDAHLAVCMLKSKL